ncbi:2-oxoadipate dioxygenase/decarboxylase family protein [Mariniblastus fucicola]|uniref:2-oxoadipate dioxygenase/decarboxylase n=1 Tax=Mariniblastus fucicola TaxID=980251 RepID=A0A5B9PH06_9BACT|nr:DUF1338 family protein [Mariniblastus fucicola]QEG24550.1 hypothetical protein MFFC18_44700 [Mariniblastus fucicola]
MSKLMTDPSWIRAEIVQRILQRFRDALPLYEDMMNVARDINLAAGEEEARRLGRVMHAAIRCASSDELQQIRGMFAVMRNEPVNYYDLREKVSVESTAFRPVAVDEIERNGFRVFCSMLSMDCIPEEHQDFVQSIIDRRHLFDDELKELIAIDAQHGGLDQEQANRFVDKCVDLFTRPEEALVSLAEYETLREINKVAAQVLISNSLAFNHLTPSVASVPAAHAEMQRRGIKTIPVWQGPVGKDVILRQTSCLAPPVVLKFPNGDGTFTTAEYQETFVEFEERLQALTRKGRVRFEGMFASGKAQLTLSEKDDGYADHYYETMQAALSDFPGDPAELWSKGLAYFTYRVDSSVEVPADVSFETAVESGLVKLLPQQYEDFFGPAATNIFNSNIGLEGVSNVGIAKPDAQSSFETLLGQDVVDMYDYYDAIEQESKRSVCESLGIDC